MKIALIRRGSVTRVDGVNRFIALLAEGLAKLGHEVFIAGWCYENIAQEKLEEWFSRLHGLDNPIPIYTLNPKPCKDDQWLRIAWDWCTKGPKLLSNERAEVAIVNGVIPLKFKPKIAVIHDIYVVNQSMSNKLIKFHILLAKRLFKQYDAIICVSNKTKNEVVEVCNLNCDVIPIPMKLNLFKPKRYNEREDIIVHIGTRPVKNPQISIKAIEILRKKGYNVKLVIIGPPAKLLEVEGVEYKYSISEKEKAELLCKAKALVLPSYYEGFSYATLEAMACGTPVVVSNAVPEEVVIDKFNGIRVNSYNPEDYASALERLLVDGELWLRLSRSDLEFVKQFDYVEIAKKYVEIFKGLGL